MNNNNDVINYNDEAEEEYDNIKKEIINFNLNNFSPPTQLLDYSSSFSPSKFPTSTPQNYSSLLNPFSVVNTVPAHVSDFTRNSHNNNDLNSNSKLYLSSTFHPSSSSSNFSSPYVPKQDNETKCFSSNDKVIEDETPRFHFSESSPNLITSSTKHPTVVDNLIKSVDNLFNNPDNFFVENDNTLSSSLKKSRKYSGSVDASSRSSLKPYYEEKREQIYDDGNSDGSFHETSKPREYKKERKVTIVHRYHHRKKKSQNKNVENEVFFFFYLSCFLIRIFI
jgi:hypothetical protein